MIKQRPTVQAIACAATTALLLLGGTAMASDNSTIYHFRQNDGTRVYTDRKPMNQRYQILRQGRATAVLSCKGAQTRAATYQPLIEKHARAQQVPASLIGAVMSVESCFNPRAVSRAGARGLMQLMPETAAELGVRDSFNADENIGGGVRYLRQMLERFNHDNSLALAAYNAGPQAVVNHGGIPPFRETRDYVQRVLAAYRDNQNAERRAAQLLKTPDA